jgi:hypothetical protein
LKTYRDALLNNLRNTREGFVSEKGRKVFTRFAWNLLRETKEAKLSRAFYMPEG